MPCQALAKRKGWPVAEVYVDNDLSAYSSKPRPAYRRMLEDVKAARVDAVIVWHLDRLHRHPRELEQFFEVCDAAAIRHLASVTGDVDLGTHDGRFMARILGAVARKESDDKSRRIRRKHEELAAAGRRHGGGSRPYGYDADHRTIRPAEAAVIREAAERILAGDSIRHVTVDLQTRGVPSATGKRWTPLALRRLLHSPRLSAQREHRGAIVAPGDWPPILTPEQTTRLRAILDDPSRRALHAPRRYLLTGLIRCGLCGERLVARPRSDGARAYICARGPQYTGCGRIKVLAEPLEELLTAAVENRVLTQEFLDAFEAERQESEPDADLAAAIAEDEAQLLDLARAWADRAISLSEWLTARDRIEARLKAARARLAASRPDESLDLFRRLQRLLDAESAMHVDQRRAFIATVLDHALVGPAVRGRNFFDPARITAVWRL